MRALNDAGNSTLSQEIYSNDAFSRQSGIQFEARVRIRPSVANGMVASFFAYSDKLMSSGNPVWSDEIDFEFLTNQINQPAATGQQVFLASWNAFGAPGSAYNDGVHHLGMNPIADNLDLTQFNTFKIRWLGDSLE